MDCARSIGRRFNSIRMDPSMRPCKSVSCFQCVSLYPIFACRFSRSRHPPMLPLTMTLSGFPSPLDSLNSTPAVYHVLAQVFPLVSLVPLSLETLNNMPFSPESKDEDLHSGYLQHPKGSLLLLTEGQVTEGGVFNKGLHTCLFAVNLTEPASNRHHEYPFYSRNDERTNPFIRFPLQQFSI